MNQAFSKIWIPIVLLVLIATGVFAWQYFGVAKEEVRAPKEVAEEAMEDETADWETYRNEVLRYEVRYPEDWVTAPTRTFRYFYPRMYKIPSEVFFTVSIAVTSPTLPFRAFGEKEENLQKTLIKERKFYWNEYQSGQTSKIMDHYLLNNDSSQIAYFLFSVRKENQYSPMQDIENTFNQMLSTFKFLE